MIWSFIQSEWRDLLEKCASTAMSSKLIHSHKDFFKKMVVDAVLSLDDDLDEGMIGMKTVAGGALQVSFNMYIGIWHDWYYPIFIMYAIC